MTMKFYVGITDWDWFTYLSSDELSEEVNFWRPSGDRAFRALEIGEPFLFKLHSPRNFIVGGGFFRYFTGLPVSFAWSAFGTHNGAKTEHEMRTRIERYRRFYAGSSEDYQIGCILLQSPFFFKEDDWIPASDWDPNIVQGRTYDTSDLRAEAIWEQVQNRLKGKTLQPVDGNGIGGSVRETATRRASLGPGHFSRNYHRCLSSSLRPHFVARTSRAGCGSHSTLCKQRTARPPKRPSIATGCAHLVRPRLHHSHARASRGG